MTDRFARHSFSRAGLLVVTHDLELLYINPEAQQLCDELREGEGPGTASELPGAVTVAVAHAARGKESPTQLRYGEGAQAISLQAFTIPQGPDEDRTIVLVIMEKNTRTQASASAPEDGLPLTDRERQVLSLMRHGHTNKEIAAKLSISEQTVKKHVSSILVKSRAGNRTGVLARLFGTVA